MRSSAITTLQTASPFRRIILITLCLLSCVSCSTKGDFERDRPSVVTDKFLPAIRKLTAESQGKPVSHFPLSDDELLLRSYRRQIGRDMEFLTIESEAKHAAAALGLAKASLPHSGKNFRSRENSVKPVVGISIEAQKNSYTLEEEVEADLLIIDRFTEVGQRVLQSDRLRKTRLRTMRSADIIDKNNVTVRARENRGRIKYVHHVARLRIKRYYRAIDQLSLLKPNDNLRPVRHAVKELRRRLSRSKIMLSHRSIRKLMTDRSNSEAGSM